MILNRECILIIDKQIKPLVKFFNSLKGVDTSGSCQGHDDGGEDGDWRYPYIKFKCTSNRSLGLLASIEYIYADLNNLYKLDEFKLSDIYQPSLKAIWTIEVVPNNDYNSTKKVREGEYALYVLKAHSDSFVKPSEVYPDFIKILDWYKTQINSFADKNEN